MSDNKIIDLKSARTATTQAKFPEESRVLANKLSALSSRMWEGIAACNMDFCNTMVTVEDARTIDEAIAALRRNAAP